MILTFNELRDKEVINVCDGKRLGYVCDVQLDADNGRICALCLPARGLSPLFKKSGGIKIPWGCIKQIGRDLILVQLEPHPKA